MRKTLTDAGRRVVRKDLAEPARPAPVASAARGMGFLCEFMIDNPGVEWLSGGSWVLTFRTATCHTELPL
jgi:hypothetical protein